MGMGKPGLWMPAVSPVMAAVTVRMGVTAAMEAVVAEGTGTTGTRAIATVTSMLQEMAVGKEGMEPVWPLLLWKTLSVTSRRLTKTSAGVTL